MEKSLQTSLATAQSEATDLDRLCDNLSFLESVFRAGRQQAVRLSDEHVTDSLVRHTSKFKNIVVGMLQRDIPLSNDSLFFKAFLKEYDLDVKFDPKDYFGEGDIIEVYDETMSQIFRNETFYRFCSYGLDDLIVHPFNYLYRRNPTVDARIMKHIQECFERIEVVEKMEIGPHFMQEHFAGNSTIFQIRHKWIAPVYSQVTGKKLAFVVTQQAERVGTSNVRGIGFTCSI